MSRKVELKDFYVIEFENGVPMFFDTMKEVRKFVNSEEFQTAIMDLGPVDEFLFFRKDSMSPSRLDLNKFILKD